MNDPTLIGPCADYEHDLVELHDGALPPERASVVRLHVAQCARCRDWAQAFASLDARLAVDLPQPRLSADFDARLHERLAALARPVVRGDLRDVIEREHDSLVDSLRRGHRDGQRRAVDGVQRGGRRGRDRRTRMVGRARRPAAAKLIWRNNIRTIRR